MWTQEHRQRAAAVATKVKRYPSNLTDAEWYAIEPLLPKAERKGRRRSAALREVVNAIRYRVRSGCGWRMLPVHFPPWQAVYWWFRRFMRHMLFRLIHDIAVMTDRKQCGRNAVPSAGIIDSQSVKCRMHNSEATMPEKWSRDQAPYCRQHRWPAIDGEFNAGRYCGFGGSATRAGSGPGTLALD